MLSLNLQGSDSGYSQTTLTVAYHILNRCIFDLNKTTMSHFNFLTLSDFNLAIRLAETRYYQVTV